VFDGFAGKAGEETTHYFTHISEIMCIYVTPRLFDPDVFLMGAPFSIVEACSPLFCKIILFQPAVTFSL